MKLFLLTPRDTESNLMFTLSFTVSYGLPSRLSCNNNLLNTNTRLPGIAALSREVIRSHYINSSHPDMTRVSIRVTLPRTAVTYACTVYVEGRDNPEAGNMYDFRHMGNADTTAGITGECTTNVYTQLYYSSSLLVLLLFSVASAPTSVMATRTGFDSVSVSWTAPSSPPAIYEVFYQVTGMSSTRLSGGTTSNTDQTLTGLSLGSYSIFVVGSGADGDLVLPSAHSNTAAVTIG